MRAWVARSIPAHSPHWAASHSPQGFVLMAVLWMIVAVATVTLTANVSSLRALRGARNRANQITAFWQASGCAAIVRSHLTVALSTARDPRKAWIALDSAVGPVQSDCTVVLRPGTVTLDANAPAGTLVRRALYASGLEGERVDSVLDLLGTARTRRFGSEAELRAARGRLLERFQVAHLFGIDSGPVFLARAPAAVAMAVRSELGPITPALSPQASPRGPPDTVARADAGAGMGGVDDAPRSWVIAVSAVHGDPPIASTITTRAILLGAGLAITGVSRQ